ncbi:MAG TPA: AarF/ABC1/UbiB kinase family protein [Anaeromyxobacteraceae bacterium]|nr:AarF/ABC1/UbiB kinase family protein [Anaeromyxobacteraceae bacterium]
MLRDAIQDLNRLRQISAVIARHGFGAYLEQVRLGSAAPRGGPEEEPASQVGDDARKAARFRQLLVDLGPTFIKLGQLLSTRPDILPSRWVDELSRLQDACAPVPVEEVRAEIERGLGRPVDELFRWLDPHPAASASIAQVHRARTHGGEEVAVKVQRPRIRDQIEADLGLLQYVARLLEALVEETGIYTPSDIVEEFDRAIHEELDFHNEARNARDMAKASRDLPFLVIPRVHDALSCATVLTLDYVDGIKASDVPGREGYDAEKVARNIIEAAFRQLFGEGIFHGDPHPGNVLVLPGNRVALIDFGLVGRIGRPVQEALVTLIMGVALRDPETVARVLYRIGVPEAHTAITSLRSDIAEILDRYLGLKLDEIQSATLLRDLLDLAIRHKIRVPKEYALLSKASVTIEGLIRGLYPDLDVLEVGLPYAKEMLFARFNPADASGTLMKSILKLQGMAEDVPAQLSQILSDLEGGKLRVNVRSESFDRIADNVRSLGLTVFLGLVASSLAMGGLVVVSRQLPGSHGLLLLGFAALLLGGFLFGAALTAYWVGGRLPKLSIRRILNPPADRR